MPSHQKRLPSQKATVGSLATGTQSTTVPHARREVVERIKKCLARANHATANETEAKAAMMMASKIMQQHNISQAQIMEDEDDAQRLKRGGMSTVNIGPRTPYGKPQFETWVYDLAIAIRTFFDSKVFSRRKRFSIEWTFYGVAEHTESAAMAFEMTHNLIQRWAYPIHGVPARNSYCIGVAQGLQGMAEDELEAAKRAAEEREAKSTAAKNAPLSTPFQQPSVVEIDNDEDSTWSPIQRSPAVKTDSGEGSPRSTPVQRWPILEIDTQCETPAELPRPASYSLKEQLMDLLPDAEDAITKVLSRYEIAWRESSTRGKFLGKFNERLERLERLEHRRKINERLERLERQAASQPSTPQRLQSAPVTPLWQSASPSPYLTTPPLRAGNKRRRADDDSGNYGVGQSEPAAKKARLDDGICGHCSARIENPRETNEGGYQSEDISDDDSVRAETDEDGHQREDISHTDSAPVKTDEDGHQREDISDDDFVLVETDEDGYQSEDISDDDSELADFNDEDSDMLDVTLPFEAELQREVSKAKSAPSKDLINSEPTKIEWTSSMQLTIYRENVAKIAEDVLKANNIKLGAAKKRKRSVKDKKQYAQGVRDSKKINVRGARIEN